MALRESARQQTIDRGLPGMMFDQADTMIQRGHVCLDKPKAGWVYDVGSWRNVSLSYCAHCGSGGVCVHQIAIAFASLLAKHCGEPAGGGSGTCGGGYSGPMPRARAKSAGGGYSHKRGGKSDRRRCPRCGSFTRGGACHNPRCKSQR